MIRHGFDRQGPPRRHRRQTRERALALPERLEHPETGRPQASTASTATPVLSADGRTVFVGDYNGYVYAFRPSAT